MGCIRPACSSSCSFGQLLLDFHGVPCTSMCAAMSRRALLGSHFDCSGCRCRGHTPPTCGRFCGGLAVSPVVSLCACTHAATHCHCLLALSHPTPPVAFPAMHCQCLCILLSCVVYTSLAPPPPATAPCDNRRRSAGCVWRWTTLFTPSMHSTGWKRQCCAVGTRFTLWWWLCRYHTR